MSQNIPPEPTPSLPRKHNSIEMSWDSQVSDPKVNVDSTNPIQARSNNVPFLNLKNPIVIRGEAVQKSLEKNRSPKKPKIRWLFNRSAQIIPNRGALFTGSAPNCVRAGLQTWGACPGRLIGDKLMALIENRLGQADYLFVIQNDPNARKKL